MIDTKEIRKALAIHGVDALNVDEVLDVLDHLEAAYKEIESWKGVAKQFGNDADTLRTHLSFAKDELNRLRAQLAPSVPEGASGEVFEHWNVVRSTQSAPNPSRMLIEDSIKEARISDIPFDFQMVGLEVPWRFAAIISKHERDACYEIAQSQLGNTNALMSNPPKSAAAWEIAQRIQARNNL